MQLTGPEIRNVMNTPNPDNPKGQANIVIVPFFEECLGSNSYDLHLGSYLLVYTNTIPYGMKPIIELDPKKQESDGYSMEDWFYKSDTEIPDALKDIKQRPGFYKYLKNSKLTPYKFYLKHKELYDIQNPMYLLDTAKEKDATVIKMPESGVILNPRFGYLGSTVEYTETFNYFPYIDGKSSGGRNFIRVHCTAGRGDDGFCGNWTLEILVQNPTTVYPGMRIGQNYYEQFVGERKPYNTNPTSHYKEQNDDKPRVAAKIPIDPKVIEFMREQNQL